MCVQSAGGARFPVPFTRRKANRYFQLWELFFGLQVVAGRDERLLITQRASYMRYRRNKPWEEPNTCIIKRISPGFLNWNHFSWARRSRTNMGFVFCSNTIQQETSCDCANVSVLSNTYTGCVAWAACRSRGSRGFSPPLCLHRICPGHGR